MRVFLAAAVVMSLARFCPAAQPILEFGFDALTPGQEGQEALKEGVKSMSLGNVVVAPVCNLKLGTNTSAQIVEVKLGAELPRQALRLVVPGSVNETEAMSSRILLTLGAVEAFEGISPEKPLSIVVRLRSGPILPRISLGANFAREKRWLPLGLLFTIAPGGELRISKTGRNTVAESEVGPLVSPGEVFTLSFDLSVTEGSPGVATKVIAGGQEMFAAVSSLAEIFAAARPQDLHSIDLYVMADANQSEDSYLEILDVKFLQ